MPLRTSASRPSPASCARCLHRRWRSSARVAGRPSTLQHGQQLRGKVEALLGAAGYHLTSVDDAHLCCGSAGTYSLLQPQIGAELRARKLAALGAGAPDVIATANIGCLTH